MPKIVNVMPDDIVFNEHNRIKQIFEYNTKEVKSFISSQIKNSNSCVFRRISKFLYKENNFDLYQIEDILRKYTIIITYHEIKKNKINIISKRLEEILLNKLDANKLINEYIDEDNVIANMFNNINYMKNREELLSIIGGLNKSTYEGIKKLLIRPKSYFQISNDFAKYNESLNSRFDCLISDSCFLNELFNEEYYNFSFKIVELDNFKKNLNLDGITQGVNKIINNAIGYVGYLCHDLIKNNNIIYCRKPNFIKPMFYRIMSLSRDVDFKVIKFIKDNNDNKVLDINEIVDFVFFYNEKLYKMTKFGIEEV